MNHLRNSFSSTNANPMKTQERLKLTLSCAKSCKRIAVLSIQIQTLLRSRSSIKEVRVNNALHGGSFRQILGTTLIKYQSNKFAFKKTGEED